MPRKVSLREILAHGTREKLDEGIVVFFPASSSLTAQDMVELHLHGSTAVMKAVLSSLSRMDGFRPAEPGEFTKLAFDNGRMDLTEVEGLRDLIESETELQRKLAIHQAGGHMREAYEAMRSKIISAMSVLEAIIDFGEDESIDEQHYYPAREKIVQLRELITRQLEQADRGEIVRNGARLAIFGAPNAGKSSFLNWLAQREASIVTAHPGTTRDVIELSLDFHGYPLIVSDTAGLRATDNEIESIGVERAKASVRSSQLKLCMIALPEAIAAVASGKSVLDPQTAELVDDSTIFVFNKIDAADVPPDALQDLFAQVKEQAKASGQALPISVKDRQGLDKLSQLLKMRLEKTFAVMGGETVLITRQRHRHHLEECLQCLDSFLSIDPSVDLVGAAEELRYAAEALGKVTGQVRVDDILDELFSSFCIGK